MIRVNDVLDLVIFRFVRAGGSLPVSSLKLSKETMLTSSCKSNLTKEIINELVLNDRKKAVLVTQIKSISHTSSIFEEGIVDMSIASVQFYTDVCEVSSWNTVHTKKQPVYKLWN